MDDRLAAWLVLREPSDMVARSSAVTQTLIDAVGGREEIRVLDLGTGTGANVRYLVPHLPRRQHWIVADRDPALLALVPDRMSSWAAAHGFGVQRRTGGCAIHGERVACEIETRAIDLGPLDPTLFSERHVVTASALLDLASERWLATLADRCRSTGAAALFALTYNGWSACLPAEPEDEMMRELLNRHQKNDKGVGGPAAGPAAAAVAGRCFSDAGYRVRSEPSDWILDTSANGLQRKLVDGWADVAIELRPDSVAQIESWRRRRHAHIALDRSQIVVGHVDIAAWLPA